MNFALIAIIAVFFIVEVEWLNVVLGVEGKLFGLPRLLVTENSFLAYALHPPIIRIKPVCQEQCLRGRFLSV